MTITNDLPGNSIETIIITNPEKILVSNSFTNANGCSIYDSIVIDEPINVIADFTTDVDAAYLSQGG
ncbi:MAG: hypothetical protein IIA45_02380 [Bacteroidetes bacterium]|nr:hypothetical protein [Bacteroidota bacterium]